MPVTIPQQTKIPSLGSSLIGVVQGATKIYADKAKETVDLNLQKDLDSLSIRFNPKQYENPTQRQTARDEYEKALNALGDPGLYGEYFDPSEAQKKLNEFDSSVAQANFDDAQAIARTEAVEALDSRVRTAILSQNTVSMEAARDKLVVDIGKTSKASPFYKTLVEYKRTLDEALVGSVDSDFSETLTGIYEGALDTLGGSSGDELKNLQQQNNKAVQEMKEGQMARRNELGGTESKENIDLQNNQAALTAFANSMGSSAPDTFTATSYNSFAKSGMETANHLADFMGLGGDERTIFLQEAAKKLEAIKNSSIIVSDADLVDKARNEIIQKYRAKSKDPQRLKEESLEAEVERIREDYHYLSLSDQEALVTHARNLWEAERNVFTQFDEGDQARLAEFSNDIVGIEWKDKDERNAKVAELAKKAVFDKTGIGYGDPNFDQALYNKFYTAFYTISNNAPFESPANPIRLADPISGVADPLRKQFEEQTLPPNPNQPGTVLGPLREGILSEWGQSEWEPVLQVFFSSESGGVEAMRPEQVIAYLEGLDLPDERKENFAKAYFQAYHKQLNARGLADRAIKKFTTLNGLPPGSVSRVLTDDYKWEFHLSSDITNNPALMNEFISNLHANDYNTISIRKHFGDSINLALNKACLDTGSPKLACSIVTGKDGIVALERTRADLGSPNPNISNDVAKWGVNSAAQLDRQGVLPRAVKGGDRVSPSDVSAFLVDRLYPELNESNALAWGENQPEVDHMVGRSGNTYTSTELQDIEDRVRNGEVQLAYYDHETGKDVVLSLSEVARLSALLSPGADSIGQNNGDISAVLNSGHPYSSFPLRFLDPEGDEPFAVWANFYYKSSDPKYAKFNLYPVLP